MQNTTDTTHDPATPAAPATAPPGDGAPAPAARGGGADGHGTAAAAPGGVGHVASARRGSTVGHVVRRGLPIVVLAGVVLAAYFYWREVDGAPGHEPAPPPQGPVPVTVVAIERETVPVRMRFLGQTEASQSVEIRARVAGYLGERTFKEGERVQKGQKLFQIDPRPFEVALAQAKAGLASAQATLERARLQVKRLTELSVPGAVSQEQVEDWQTQARVAAAQVEQQKAQIAAAELELGYTSIESPITGMIGQALKDTGSYVDAGANGLLALVQQVDPIYVRYSVTEQEMLRFQRQLAAGQIASPGVEEVELEITLADGSVYPHRGRINFVDVDVDETTGTSVVRGQVANPDGVLKPGQFIHASVLGIQRVNVVRVPQKAVSQSPTGASVMVANEKNVAEARPVQLGEWSGTEHWIVERGLNPGDRVITDRLMMVRPGTEVAPTVAPAAPAQAADAGRQQSGDGATTQPSPQLAAGSTPAAGAAPATAAAPATQGSSRR